MFPWQKLQCWPVNMKSDSESFLTQCATTCTTKQDNKNTSYRLGKKYLQIIYWKGTSMWNIKKTY